MATGSLPIWQRQRTPNIASIGMVTGAVWANVVGDDAKELIITGEWMAPRIFSWKGDRFTEVKSNLNELFGLWQTVVATDVNNDGKNRPGIGKHRR